MCLHQRQHRTLWHMSECSSTIITQNSHSCILNARLFLNCTTWCTFRHGWKGMCLLVVMSTSCEYAYDLHLYMCVLLTTYRCGPMMRYWCMRYESKHSYFKDLAQKTKCFKNIPKSLAERHQRLVCYHFHQSKALVKEIETGKGTFLHDTTDYFTPSACTQGNCCPQKVILYAKYTCVIWE